MPPTMPKGLESYLSALMERSAHDALIFSERIAKATSVMGNAGMSASAISIALNDDLVRGGKIFGELTNSIKSGINEGVNQSGRLGQVEQYPPGEKNYSWVTVGGHKVCPDCDARTGDVKTWDEWVGEGLPGSGWSICGGHCYCVLDPVGKWDSRIEGTPPGVKEPGATMRPKAPTGSKMEKRLYKEYKLTKRQIAKYERTLKLDTPSGRALLKDLNMTREQVYAELDAVRGKLSKIAHTKDKYYNAKTGKWTKDRALLHEKIARDVVNKGKVATKGDPEFLMTGGYPGSGKSTMLKQAFPGYKKKFVHIDSDLVKDLLAQYDGMEKVGWRAAAYHRESKAVLNRIFDLARSEKRHILFDGTMKSSGKMLRKIADYKKAGYKMRAAFADLPMEQSMHRAIARYFGDSGRFVDPIYIATHGNLNIATFEELKKLVEFWMHYNTNVAKYADALLVNSFP